MNTQANLLVLSGPSGIGKDTVAQRLIQLHPGIECSVSATTRPPRDYEHHGEHYFFMSEDAFKTHLQQGDILEHTVYVGNYYGTLKQQIDEKLRRGVACLLVIEVEGAANLKRLYPGCTTIFILPPSMQELERRLRSRGTESEDWVQKRMRRATEEMKYAENYDSTVVNYDVDACAEEIYRILCKHRK